MRWCQYTVGELKGIFNGKRQFRMELVRDIPSFLFIGGSKAHIRYFCQPRTCFRCGEEGHEARSCPTAVASARGARGHVPPGKPCGPPPQLRFEILKKYRSPVSSVVRIFDYHVSYDLILLRTRNGSNLYFFLLKKKSPIS
ncbi:Zinc finger CCHC domain-containing protein 3 [Holothuria leucospilota]|uniref:Zinc finger CCHC domain-containing protein 3 n=1 Tax=Holothuria leucospilota TaxID=206669 RepID=A0A9Q1HIJ3_HOLLE|nr:Zinc finger CCHC domain-containing protein 3 [Holothuria leucospilota]